jgi:hypothetical protein
MIEKVVRKGNLQDFLELKENLTYWLSRTPGERIAAVEHLRRQHNGGSAKTLRDLLALFNSHKVDYIIVGAYALAYHGVPRYTGDMDIFVLPSLENAERILRALDEFGFGSLNLKVEDFATPNKVVQIGVAPVRIDIVTSLTGVSWEEAGAGRLAGTYGDLKVYYIGKKEFILNKSTLGRKKDLADLEAIGEK